MAEHSTIEWTDATWNPITGCSVVSPGCTNCYAMGLAGTRLQHHPSRAGLTRPSKAGPVWNGEVRLNEEWLTQPLHWKRPRMIFVCAHGDLFHESVPDEWIDRVFAIMALCPQHSFQVLTKRSARMRAYMAGHQSAIPYLGRMPLERIHLEAAGHMQGDGGFMDALKQAGNVYSLYLDTPWPLPNVWLGVSAEDQRRADERVPDLLATPAAVRFVSAEPLLGPIDFEAMPFAEGDRRHRWSALTGQAIMHATGKDGHPDCTVRLDKPIFSRLDWIIVGGESGPNARPMHPAWARSIRDQCNAAGTAFLFKQWGAWKVEIDRDTQDSDWRANYSGRLNDREADIAWLNIEGGRGFHGEAFHVMRRVGKKAAGRLLDGREHNGMPEARS